VENGSNRVGGARPVNTKQKGRRNSLQKVQNNLPGGAWVNGGVAKRPAATRHRRKKNALKRKEISLGLKLFGVRKGLFESAGGESGDLKSGEHRPAFRPPGD